MNQRQHTVDLVFALALFGVFMLTAFLTVLMGAKVYGSVTDAASAHYDTRTALSYLSQRVRQNDTAGAVSVTKIGGEDALMFSEEYDGQVYTTSIYFYEGSLYELFSAESVVPNPKDGTRFADVSSFSATIKDNVLSLSIRDNDGKAWSLVLTLRSETEAAA